MDNVLDPEWEEWYAMTPLERWRETAKLWAFYQTVGGSLDPEPDSQSPFDAAYRRSPYLLMGGQACVIYGAAELVATATLRFWPTPRTSIQSVNPALADPLEAECIAVPPFELEYLLRGHAVHFRSHHPEAGRNANRRDGE